jgi:hypothetical protein
LSLSLANPTEERALYVGSGRFRPQA